MTRGGGALVVVLLAAAVLGAWMWSAWNADPTLVAPERGRDPAASGTLDGTVTEGSRAAERTGFRPRIESGCELELVEPGGEILGADSGVGVRLVETGATLVHGDLVPEPLARTLTTTDLECTGVPSRGVLDVRLEGRVLYVVVALTAATPITVLDGAGRPLARSTLDSLEVVVTREGSRSVRLPASASSTRTILRESYRFALVPRDTDRTLAETAVVAPEPVVLVLDRSRWGHFVAPGRAGIVVRNAPDRILGDLEDGHAWLDITELEKGAMVSAWGEDWHADEVRLDEARITSDIEFVVRPAETKRIQYVHITAEAHPNSFSNDKWDPLTVYPRGAGRIAARVSAGEVLLLNPSAQEAVYVQLTAFERLTLGFGSRALASDGPLVIPSDRYRSTHIDGSRVAGILQSLGVGSGFRIKLEQRVPGLPFESWRPVRTWYTQGPYLNILKRNGFDIVTGEDLRYRMRIVDRHGATQQIRTLDW
jgi:hypothetical protein